ncbi:MAG: hypothetical protein AAGA77_04595 [Bacteroidota bacterium]
MKLKTGIVVLGMVLFGFSSYGQANGNYFYDTLTIMDYTTNTASERLSQLRKPINRKFYLKSDVVSYSLFKGEVVQLNAEQISSILENGLSLFIDKLEHQGHKNLKPSVMEILDANKNVVETVDLDKIKRTALNTKIKKDSVVRFTRFIISVNEEKLGPIFMDVQVVE